MDRPDAEPEPTPTLKRLHDLLKRFEEACLQQPGAAALRAYVPPPGDSLRSLALPELVKADLEFHWQRGQKVYLDAYFQPFPELASPVLLPRLLYEEYRLRHQYGDKPDPAVYQARFPDQFEAFRRLLHERPPVTAAATFHVPSQPPPAKGNLGPAQGKILPIGGGYKLLKRVGRGGFGEVWRAEAPGGVEVAVKIILRLRKEEQAERELQAVELTKRLRHQALLPVHTIWSLDDRIIIVMELADGSLRQRLRECRTADPLGIPLDELLTYFRDSAEALDYLHSKQVIHRDVKPDNILILGRHAKVADFSLAKMLEGRNQATESTSGTPSYMPPEIWRGVISVHSDQYSLALTYAEMRLDRCVFKSDRISDLIFAQLEQPPNLDPLGVAEQQVLLKALAKNPDERYGSCTEFVQALEEALLPSRGRRGRGVSVAADAGIAPREAASAQVPAQPTRVSPATPTAGSVGGPDPGTLGHVQAAPTPGRVPADVFVEPADSDELRPTWLSEIEPRSRFPRVLASLVVLGVLAAVGAATIWFRATHGPRDEESPRPDRIAESPPPSAPVQLDPRPEVPDVVGEIRTFAGHTQLVNSVALSHDGRYALSGADDRTARLWDLADGKETRRFTGHQKEVQGVAFSPDSRFVLTGSRDKTVRLWEIANPAEPRVFTGHTEEVCAVAFAPDGRSVLSGGGYVNVEGGKDVPSDCVVRQWDVKTGELLCRLSGHTGPVRSVAFSPDGKYALSGSDDDTLRLWDLAKGTEVRVFLGHKDVVRSVAFAPDGKHALSGGRDKQVLLWDVADARVVRRFEGHTNDVWSVAFSPDGLQALSGSSDGTLRWWDTSNGRALQQFAVPDSGFLAVAVSADGRRALSGGTDNLVRLWGLPK